MTQKSLAFASMPGRGGKAAAAKRPTAVRQQLQQALPRRPTVSKPPKLAAVTLSIPTRPKTSLCDAMAEAKRKIRLDDLGITKVKPKRAITGELIIEIFGENSEERADKLCNAMKAALSHTDVRVARPTKTCEIRIRGLDDSVTPEEVAETIASAGGCRPNAVSAGPTRTSSSGLNSVWVQCPVSAAKKVADVGTLRVE
ncbi:uncharacterized protein LOC109861256 [Pseudomyrmex gracilis]|uniref:uncharacterized protein LOC109861256 n=1 Tax=Pseudomyrmex gracilis TaxID=219809 RepID=UPI000995210B|nr:uncharacterized protein LOC109861256 [Pseudomyrmex gracilis]